MLVVLTRAMRKCAARLLAAAYLLCVLAPAASFAFGDGTRAAHCLTDELLGLTSTHVHMTAEKVHEHADGTSHVHSGKAADSKHDHGKASSDGQCCGLFCFSALPASGFQMALPSLLRGPAELTMMQGFVEQPPPGHFRPPPSLLPV